jgi:hypothetical protein
MGGAPVTAPVEVFAHGALCRHGESFAEFAYSQMHGVGEAEAKRRLPAFVAMVESMARATAATENASNVDDFVDVARRGFRVRASELGLMGMREPETMMEAFKRRRLRGSLKLLDAVHVGRATADYIVNLGVDPAIIAARCGRLVVVPGGHPLIADAASKEDVRLPHVFCEVRDFDGESAVDLVVWAINRSDEWYAGHGVGVMLGHVNVETPSESPLRVHRDPESWLRAECDGVVIIRQADAWRDLGRWSGYIVAEDIEHARELSCDGQPFFDIARIGVAA